MKTKKTVALLFMVILVVTLLSGCSKEPPTYSAVSGFYYSGDKGHTYGDGTKEYVIGETVYMEAKYRVASNESKP